MADDEELERAVRGAHLPTLLMSLVHLTGDRRWLAEPYRPARPRGPKDPDDGCLPEEVQDEIRSAAVAAYRRWRAGEVDLFVPDLDGVTEMMRVCVGDDVPAESAEMIAEEVGIADRDQPWLDVPDAPAPDGFRVIVIGTGFAGLGLAMKLERAGIPYLALEKNGTVGGTWLENRYPGCKVDSPSHLYQFSHEPYPTWPRYYSLRDDIHAYLERCADAHGVREHTRFNTEVRSARWDASRELWELKVDGPSGPERLVANVVVSAVGQLNRPAVPTIPGAEIFAGPALHTAVWDPSIDLRGKRVAVIGTGASAMQFVPAAAGVAEHVTVFQRSPQWAVPNPDLDRIVGPEAHWLLTNMPYYAGWWRYRQFWYWNDHIHPTLQIDPDWPHPERSINAMNEAHRVYLTEHITTALAGRPDLIAKCLPTYPPYGKRGLMDAGWFTTVRRDDVSLVTAPVKEIRADRLVDGDGVEHPVDVIVYATGFEAKRMLWPMDIRGSEGTIREAWGDDDPRAYLGIAIPGFPNFFTLYGPNTNLGHGGSVVFHNELQVRYVMGLLRQMLAGGHTTLEVRQDVHDEYNERVDAAHDRMIWSHRGMDTWYRNAKGRIVTNSPWRLVDYWRMTRLPDLAEYHLTPGERLASSDLIGSRRPDAVGP